MTIMNGFCKRPQKSTGHIRKGSYLSKIESGTFKNGHAKIDDKVNEEMEDPPYHSIIFTYVSFGLFFLFGYISELLIKLGLKKITGGKEYNRPGYPPLYLNFESFYIRNVYRRMSDCFHSPLCGLPGPVIRIMERESRDGNATFRLTGRSFDAINMGSYNYLAFAENSGPRTARVEDTIRQDGVGICSTRHELGTHRIVLDLERMMASFLGVEDCIVFGMGFATNSTNIPTILGKGSLILSDKLNHASLILGSRLSGATIRVFKHNNVQDLEKTLRNAIIQGQPRTGRAWKKIIIMVEGIYSMEGSLIDLPAIIALKKKYKAYLYLDEAHSIGAMGPTGRGVVDYYGCDPRDIDILMGTFTKSFGSCGGYIAGTNKVISHIRAHSQSFSYATSMSPPIARQIIEVIRALTGEDGTNDGIRKIRQLARNTRYFRTRLKQMGFIIYGHMDSPVIPLLLIVPSKISVFFKELMARGVASVVVGYPATPLFGFRARFCLSAGHTKEMLDRALEAIDSIGDLLKIKYSSHPWPKENVPY